MVSSEQSVAGTEYCAVSLAMWFGDGAQGIDHLQQRPRLDWPRDHSSTQVSK